MRKAGHSLSKLGKIARFSGRSALPRNAMDLAMDWGGDLIVGGAYAASLPGEVVSGPEKLGVAAEDTLIGVGGSMVGRAIVTAMALPFVGPRAARGLGQYVGGMGGGLVANMVAPRPFMGRIDKRLQQQAEEDQRIRDEALIAQGVRMGGMGLAQSRPVQGLDYLLGGYG